jgi:ABC-type transport system substrate-binding protein
VIWSNNGSESMFLYTLPVLPVDPQSSFGGAAIAQWYASGGTAGIKPTDPALLKGFELLRSAASQPEEKRTQIAQELWKMLVDEVWSIGLVGQSPAYMGTRVVNERLENVPARTCTSQHCRTPQSGHAEQWYYR